MRPASCRCDARSNVDAFTRCRSRDQRLFYARNKAFALPKLDGVPIHKMFRPDGCVFVVGTDECAETYDVSVLANRTSSIPVHTAFLPISSVPVCLLPNMPTPIPGTYDAGGHYLGGTLRGLVHPPSEEDMHFGARPEARSRAMFPAIGQERERVEWMTKQEQRSIEHEINRTKALVYPVGAR
jgi:hypothetical protein